MSLNHCIELVSTYDRDKFLAIMTCESRLRKAMFPIYAFNIEVSRIPWITSDNMIAEMRLMWWKDLLDSIEEDKPPSNHPITAALKHHLVENRFAIKLLKDTIRARSWDIYSKNHESVQNLWNYIECTSSNLLIACLGLDASITSYGRGIGMASYFLAVPRLLNAGKNPLPDLSDEAIYILAQDAMKEIESSKTNPLNQPKLASFRVGWMAPIILKKVMKDPRSVINGRLQSSEFRKKIRLLRLTYLNFR